MRDRSARCRVRGSLPGCWTGQHDAMWLGLDKIEGQASMMPCEWDPPGMRDRSARCRVSGAHPGCGTGQHVAMWLGLDKIEGQASMMPCEWDPP